MDRESSQVRAGLRDALAGLIFFFFFLLFCKDFTCSTAKRLENILNPVVVLLVCLKKFKRYRFFEGWSLLQLNCFELTASF